MKLDELINKYSFMIRKSFPKEFIEKENKKISPNLFFERNKTTSRKKINTLVYPLFSETLVLANVSIAIDIFNLYEEKNIAGKIIACKNYEMLDRFIRTGEIHIIIFCGDVNWEDEKTVHKKYTKKLHETLTEKQKTLLEEILKEKNEYFSYKQFKKIKMESTVNYLMNICNKKRIQIPEITTAGISIDSEDIYELLS